MLFNSFHFLLFFPIVCALRFSLPARLVPYVLLLASYYFYMAWEPRYAVLILSSTLVDYWVGMRLSGTAREPVRRRLLLVSLATNLGLLFTFKYFNFFTESAQELVATLEADYLLPHLNVLLPVGISFYTFQTLSYTIDVYRGKCPAETDFARFALYVSFFPQLVAGPIERASRLLPQLKERMAIRFDFERLVSGLKQMVWGFFKKVVVADRMAVVVNAAYDAPESASGFVLLVATYAFAFQIYCDFSGYSDIAIGAARVLGIDLMENFRAPYFARSISEFWRRWHISLSTWFRDYVYLPLGGRSEIFGRRAANLMIVFLLSGLWHGANWTFLIWGALHGSFLVLGVWLAPLTARIGAAMTRRGLGLLWALGSILTTFHIVIVGWIFFRAESVSSAFSIVMTIVSDFGTVGIHAPGSPLAAIAPFYLAVTFLLAGALVAAEVFEHSAIELPALKRSVLLRQVGYAGVLVLIAYFGVFSNGEQFIYFQF